MPGKRKRTAKGFVAKLKNSKRAKKVAEAAKKAILSKEGRETLRKVAKRVKGVVRSVIDSKCPKCGEVSKKMMSNPAVKKLLESADRKMRSKCKTCGEVLDVVVKA